MSLTEEGARAVTPDEVAHYREYGWVKLENYVPAETVARMLEIAKAELAAGEASGVVSVGQWQHRLYLGRDDGVEPYASLVRDPTMARNTQKLMQRDVPVGLVSDLLAVKMPAGDKSSMASQYHQDFVSYPLDRTGSLVFWLALDDMGPDQGTMRFYSRSHREGPLGTRSSYEQGFDLGVPDLEDSYADIAERCPLSPPLSLRAGDCTVHDSLTVHGAPANRSDKPRWGYIISYYPGDARYTGAATHTCYGTAPGLKVGEEVRSPIFPMVAGE